MTARLWPLWTGPLLWVIALLRQSLARHPRLGGLVHTPAVQPFLARLGRLQARAVFVKASQTCPAYRALLQAEGHTPHGNWRLDRLPTMTKDNYVRRYGIEQRCYHGRLPRSGVVIDESSGSTGQPNNWVRSAGERTEIRRSLQASFRMLFPGPGRVLLNCFALGPWATGMNVSMSLAEAGILKSIGPDAAKLANTLALFGPRYPYVVFGYPPFLRHFVDTCPVDLSAYTIDFVVGGEAMSEDLRTHLMHTAGRVISSYGASDLEINIGIETPATTALRRLLCQQPALSRTLFGRDTPPMLFQYNALDYVIETTPDTELLVTIARRSAAAPKIRYNIRDLGGTYAFADLAARLAPHGIDLASLAPPTSHLPILFVYGRNDSSVPFYGAKLFPSDVEQVISGSPLLQGAISTFQLATEADARHRSLLHIHLERIRAGTDEDLAAWHRELFAGLQQVNQDFREISRLFDPAQIIVHPHNPGTGPFADEDIRIKHRYVA